MFLKTEMQEHAAGVTARHTPRTAGTPEPAPGKENLDSKIPLSSRDLELHNPFSTEYSKVKRQPYWN